MVKVFKHGDLVFGKVRGYPPWPARVDETLMPGLKITKTKVPVFFFGTHEIGILAPKDVFLYVKHKKTLGLPQKRTGFNRGLHEIEHKPNLTLKRNIKTEKENDSSSDSSDETTTESDSSSISTKDEPPPTKKAKPTNGTSNKISLDTRNNRAHSLESNKNGQKSSDISETSSSQEESNDDDLKKSDSDKSWKEEESFVDKRQSCDNHKVKRPTYPLKKNNYAEKWQLYYERQLNTSLSQTQSTPITKSNNTVQTKELRVVCLPTENAAVTTKPPENNLVHRGTELKADIKMNVAVCVTTKDSQCDVGDVEVTAVTKGKENDGNKNSKSCNIQHQQFNENDDSPKGNVLHTVPILNVEHLNTNTAITVRKAQRLKQQMEAGELVADDKLKNKIAKKEKEKEQKKKEKYERKKREKYQLLRSEVKLLALDVRIKESLCVTKQDIVKCIDAMEKLDAMTVTPLMLKKNPGIVFTLRKCCRFKNSEKVRLKADYIYNKFKSMFLVGQGETFSQVFQRDTQNLKELATRLKRDVNDMTEDIIPAVSKASDSAGT